MGTLKNIPAKAILLGPEILGRFRRQYQVA
jgi:hypothetical protein